MHLKRSDLELIDAPLLPAGQLGIFVPSVAISYNMPSKRM